MPEFLIVLSLYYACDTLAVEQPLRMSEPELAQCMSHYEAVKDSFTQDGSTGYAAFKAWEAANPETVAEARRMARAHLTDRR